MPVLGADSRLWQRCAAILQVPTVVVVSGRRRSHMGGLTATCTAPSRRFSLASRPAGLVPATRR